VTVEPGGVANVLYLNKKGERVYSKERSDPQQISSSSFLQRWPIKMANRRYDPKGERLSVSVVGGRPIRITIHTRARIGFPCESNGLRASSLRPPPGLGDDSEHPPLPERFRTRP